jgi:hypothetical protein
LIGDASGLVKQGYGSERLKSSISIDFRAVADDGSINDLICERRATEDFRGSFYMASFNLLQLLNNCNDRIVKVDEWHFYLQKISFVVQNRSSGVVLAEGNVLGNALKPMFEYSVHDIQWRMGQDARPLVLDNITTVEKPK